MYTSELVVIPTYNERDNLRTLIENILALKDKVDVLVVDDNSPDGTGALADTLAERTPEVKVLHRQKKVGLGPAIFDGLLWATKRDYNSIITLDADFSHDVNDIPGFITASKTFDVVIGSRYKNGIRVRNWGLKRLLLSLGAARFVRVVMGMPFADPTSGFRCYTREALKQLLNKPLLSRGYVVHLELAFKAWRKGMRVTEIPIVYTERRCGESKLTKGIIVEAIWVALLLRASRSGRRGGEA